jgi:endoglucanase Acf2
MLNQVFRRSAGAVFAAAAIVATVSLGVSSNRATADDQAVPLGAGSYSLKLPQGAKLPPRRMYGSSDVRGKMPTNDWWSSLAWLPFSDRQFPHPLGVQAEPAGLRVFHSGARITSNKDGIFGFSPGPGGGDLTLGHSAQAEFPSADVDRFSDWFVTAKFRQEDRVLRVSYGHGSPFVFAKFEGGSPRLTFHEIPRIWGGDASHPVLGLTVGDRHYGLFAPVGAKWSGLGSKTVTCLTDKPYFSLAALPDASKTTLDLFLKHAYAHVIDTQVHWTYDPQASLVTTRFRFVTEAVEGTERNTLFALYPHQWRYSDQKLLGLEYPSVRGRLKLAMGSAFETRMAFPGVLPCLPNAGGGDAARMRSFLKAEADLPEPPFRDTYWDGKWLGRTASLVSTARQYDQAELADKLLDRLRRRLEYWFTAATPKGQPKSSGLFYYDDLWGTLIGYPASYGSDDELNDHHFHYGYFLRAAAEVALHDRAWGNDERWGAMVKLLARDMANPRHDDPLFPFLRNFDPYAGHSWASGHAKFADGNNNESSSEAMNAWCGLILWGEATGDQALRDLGIYLFTTEMNAIDEYWFDVHDENHPPDYLPSVVTMIWGGKGANATWFTANPEAIHGINWLPIHGGSLYLGHFPAYVAKNYAALAAENKGTTWDEWADLIWMYRALVDPEDAARQFEAGVEKTAFEAGNSRANAYHWISTLANLGRVDPTVTANTPLYAVFGQGQRRTYCVYNPTDKARSVTFSDGHVVQAKERGFTVDR